MLNKKEVDERNKKEVDERILGYLSRRLSQGADPTVTVVELVGFLKLTCGMTVTVDDLRSAIDKILDEYSWLGVGWRREDKEDLCLMPGLHWYVSSSMYRKLLENRYERLGSVFARVVDCVIPQSFNRLLVDAGSTVFWCLHNKGCKLVGRAREILTNNLFVVQRLSQLDGRRNVKLIGGVWDVDKGAMVRCGDAFTGGLSAMMKVQKRQPTVALLSYHYVTMGASREVTVWTKSDLEDDMKRVACLECTRDVVFVVLEASKLGLAPEEKDGETPVPYELTALRDLQTNYTTVDKSARGKRRVYFISDLTSEGTLEMRSIADRLCEAEFVNDRIFFVSPYKSSSTDVKNTALLF